MAQKPELTISPQAELVECWEQRPGSRPVGSCCQHTPTPAWGLLSCISRGTRLLPEDGGEGTGVPSHTEHAQALGEQHKRQQDPIQE